MEIFLPEAAFLSCFEALKMPAEERAALDFPILLREALASPTPPGKDEGGSLPEEDPGETIPEAFLHCMAEWSEGSGDASITGEQSSGEGCGDEERMLPDFQAQTRGAAGKGKAEMPPAARVEDASGTGIPYRGSLSREPIPSHEVDGEAGTLRFQAGQRERPFIGGEESLTRENPEVETGRGSRESILAAGKENPVFKGQPGSLPEAREAEEEMEPAPRDFRKELRTRVEHSPGPKGKEGEDQSLREEGRKESPALKREGTGPGQAEGALPGGWGNESFPAAGLEKAAAPPGLAARVFHSLMENIRINTVDSEDGVEEIRVRLKPESLGDVHIRISREDGIVTGRILVDNSMVKEMLENRLPLLRDRLLEMDVDMGDIHVSLGSDSEGRGRPGSGARQRPGAWKIRENPAVEIPAAPGTRWGRGILDTTA